MRRTRALSNRALLSCALLSTCACNLNNLGDPPPAADIYFPTGLALSSQSSSSPPRLLYLINSNFDLRYNGGSVQAYDLEALNAAIDACPSKGEDCVIPSSSAIVDEVFVPSLATSFALTPAHDRLYVATRTDPSVSFIDVNEDAAAGGSVFQCDQTEHRCGEARKRGDDPNEGPSARARLVLPAEPVGMVTIPESSVTGAAPQAGEPNYLLVSHRGGQASLFYDNGGTGTSGGPFLISIVSNLLTEPTGVTFDPMTRLAYMSVYARGSTTALPKILLRIGIAPDNNDPLKTFVYDAGLLSLDGVSWSRDTRDLAMSPSQPGEALVVSIDPAALLWVDVAGSQNGTQPAGSAPARQTLALATGPSRLALGEVGGHSIAAVSCFDAQQIFIVDTTSAQVLTIVHNLNGPFELAIDANRQRLYVADFRSSVVRVLDLAPVVQDAFGGRTDAPVIGTLGIPKVVQELQ